MTKICNAASWAVDPYIVHTNVRVSICNEVIYSKVKNDLYKLTNSVRILIMNIIAYMDL